MDDKKKVLFICTHNSARSHMAEGFMNTLLGDHYEAWSAGTDPSVVNPTAVKVMAEVGIDLSAHHSKGLEGFLDREWDYVVTVCDNAKEACPFFPGGSMRIHKGFRDPAGIDGSDAEKLILFRQVRDQIRVWIEKTF
jgi:arsenate reductase